MTSTPERFGLRAALVAVALAQGCGLERPPDPPPFDCARIDRAAERFPDACGGAVDAAADPDAGASDAGP